MNQIIKNRKKSPLASKLKEARIARGLTISDLAKEIGVSRQAVSKYELNQSSPSTETFNKIIQVLKFPLAFFFTEDDINTSIESPIYFRSLKSADRKNRDISEIRAIWMHKIYEFLKTYINFPELNLPDINDDLIKDAYDQEDIENIALELRNYWKLGNGPIDNFTLLLEKNGFILTKLNINDSKIDAFSRWIGNKHFIFLGSDKNCAVRSRFDLGHELGHAILHRHIHADDLINPKILKRIEKEANMFASAFLLPSDSFGMEVMSTSLDHFILLKKRWKTSIQAMIYRCHDLGYLSDDQTLYLRKKMASLNMRKQEPLDDELEPENPVVLKQAIQMLLENNIITNKTAREKFNIPVEELEDLLSLDRGALSEKAQVITLDLKSRNMKNRA